MRLILTSLLAAVVTMSTLVVQAPRVPADCNRACLESLGAQIAASSGPPSLPSEADVPIPVIKGAK